MHKKPSLPDEFPQNTSDAIQDLISGRSGNKVLGLLKFSRRELLVPWPWAACSTAGLIAVHSSAMMSLDHDANSIPPMDGGNSLCISETPKNTCADPLKKNLLPYA